MQTETAPATTPRLVPLARVPEELADDGCAIVGDTIMVPLDGSIMACWPERRLRPTPPAGMTGEFLCCRPGAEVRAGDAVLACMSPGSVVVLRRAVRRGGKLCVRYEGADVEIADGPDGSPLAAPVVGAVFRSLRMARAEGE